MRGGHVCSWCFVAHRPQSLTGQEVTRGVFCPGCCPRCEPAIVTPTSVNQRITAKTIFTLSKKDENYRVNTEVTGREMIGRSSIALSLDLIPVLIPEAQATHFIVPAFLSTLLRARQVHRHMHQKHSFQDMHGSTADKHPETQCSTKKMRHERTEMCNAEVAGETQVRCTFVIRKASRNPQCLCDRFVMILRKVALLRGNWVRLIVCQKIVKRKN